MRQKKTPDKLTSVLALTGMVTLFLLLLYAIPESFLDKYGLRRIDILSDIRVPAIFMLEQEKADSIPVLLEVPKEEPCPDSLSCFVDFSEERNGLDTFFHALSNIDSLGRPLRIAFFGDSFIEGDIFSGDLRELMQEEFGGRGVGFVPVTSHITGFRRTVGHSFANWRNDSVKSWSKMGINCDYFQPDSSAWVSYKGVTIKPYLDSCSRVSLLYVAQGNVGFNYNINRMGSQQAKMKASRHVQRFDITTDDIGSVSFSFPDTSRHYRLFGVSLEDTTGIIVDNFAKRGETGRSLLSIPQQTFADFDSLLHYDLVILQYGLNSITSKVTDYSRYEEDMIKTVEYVKECMPNSSILLISIGDRSMRQQGAYVTMPSVPAMVMHQQRIAAQTGIVFWNLYEAMGGSGSMIDMVNAQPPRANKDFTHLTFAGGEYLAGLLYNTLIYEKSRYDKRMELVKTNEEKEKHNETVE